MTWQDPGLQAYVATAFFVNHCRMGGGGRGKGKKASLRRYDPDQVPRVKTGVICFLSAECLRHPQPSIDYAVETDCSTVFILCQTMSRTKAG